MKGVTLLKEKLYAIPVNEAYEADTECPLCYMVQKLDEKFVEFSMGSSYMEDHVRAITDEIGYCSHHLDLLYQKQNQLGLALILKSHIDRTIETVEITNSQKLISKKTLSSFLGKQNEESSLVSYINQLDNSCFICDKVNNSFDRYVATIFHLYKSDEDFPTKASQIKGYCTSHYGLLHDRAQKSLKEKYLESFLDDLNNVYLENMKRVRDDLDWFIDKFDYRYKDAPWKNSKDALLRAMLKTNGLTNKS